MEDRNYEAQAYCYREGTLLLEVDVILDPIHFLPLIKTAIVDPPNPILSLPGSLRALGKAELSRVKSSDG